MVIVPMDSTSSSDSSRDWDRDDVGIRRNDDDLDDDDDSMDTDLWLERYVSVHHSLRVSVWSIMWIARNMMNIEILLKRCECEFELSVRWRLTIIVVVWAIGGYTNTTESLMTVFHYFNGFQWNKEGRLRSLKFCFWIVLFSTQTTLKRRFSEERLGRKK